MYRLSPVIPYSGTPIRGAESMKITMGSLSKKNVLAVIKTHPKIQKSQILRAMDLNPTDARKKQLNGILASLMKSGNIVARKYKGRYRFSADPNNRSAKARTARSSSRSRGARGSSPRRSSRKSRGMEQADLFSYKKLEDEYKEIDKKMKAKTGASKPPAAPPAAKKKVVPLPPKKKAAAPPKKKAAAPPKKKAAAPPKKKAAAPPKKKAAAPPKKKPMVQAAPKAKVLQAIKDLKKKASKEAVARKAGHKVEAVIPALKALRNEGKITFYPGQGWGLATWKAKPKPKVVKPTETELRLVKLIDTQNALWPCARNFGNLLSFASKRWGWTRNQLASTLRKGMVEGKIERREGLYFLKGRKQPDSRKPESYTPKGRIRKAKK